LVATYRRIGLTAAAAAAMTLTPLSHAQAAPAYGCDYPNTLVIYMDPNYGGECRSMANPQFGDLRILEINDQISSLRNLTPNTLCFYSDANDGGTNFQIHGWEWWPGIPSWTDNQISSIDYC
jgi:Peptidase inhibitor family I36